MTVGERLRKARRKIRKRQADIAAEVGVTQPTVYEWEHDQCSPSGDRIRDVAAAYGLDPLDLLPKKKRAA